MRHLKAEADQFARLWKVSLQLGVQAGVVWAMVDEHRPVVLATRGISKSWRWRCLDPADVRCLILGDDFHHAARTIIRDDAPWYVWSHDVHTVRYVEQDLARAWRRTWKRHADAIGRIEQELIAMQPEIANILALGR